VGFNLGAVASRANGFQPLVIELMQAVQEFKIFGIENDTGIEKLLPLHPGHYAYDRVFK